MVKFFYFQLTTASLTFADKNIHETRTTGKLVPLRTENMDGTKEINIDQYGLHQH